MVARFQSAAVEQRASSALGTRVRGPGSLRGKHEPLPSGVPRRAGRPPRARIATISLATLVALAACASEGPARTDEGAGRPPQAGDATVRVREERAAPSSRHGEYVMYATAAGDSVRAFVVYPERPDAAPGLIVIHEIFGLTDWVRSVADRYAAEGFVAIAPDLLWGRGPGGGGTAAYPDPDAVISAIRELPPDVIQARLNGAREYLRSLPSVTGRVGTVGFCWGGHQSFQYAAEQPALDAAVVFYGSGPEPPERAAGIEAPVLGLYGGEDNRVNASIPAVERVMQAAGRRYEKEIYAGAGHGFLREDTKGANARAAARAWQRSVAFLRATLATAEAMRMDDEVLPLVSPTGKDLPVDHARTSCTAAERPLNHTELTAAKTNAKTQLRYGWTKISNTSPGNASDNTLS